MHIMLSKEQETRDLAALTANVHNLSIAQIARNIREDWNGQAARSKTKRPSKAKGVWFGAVPYLSAMHSLSTVNDTYGLDTGRSIVVYFLSNAGTYRGPKARLYKAELKRRLAA